MGNLFGKEKVFCRKTPYLEYEKHLDYENTFFRIPFSLNTIFHGDQSTGHYYSIMARE